MGLPAPCECNCKRTSPPPLPSHHYYYYLGRVFNHHAGFGSHSLPGQGNRLFGMTDLGLLSVPQIEGM